MFGEIKLHQHKKKITFYIILGNAVVFQPQAHIEISFLFSASTLH